jgi:hypothetical protein
MKWLNRVFAPGDMSHTSMQGYLNTGSGYGKNLNLHGLPKAEIGSKVVDWGSSLDGLGFIRDPQTAFSLLEYAKTLKGFKATQGIMEFARISNIADKGLEAHDKIGDLKSDKQNSTTIFQRADDFGGKRKGSLDNGAYTGEVIRL